MHTAFVMAAPAAAASATTVTVAFAAAPAVVLLLLLLLLLLMTGHPGNCISVELLISESFSDSPSALWIFIILSQSSQVLQYVPLNCWISGILLQCFNCISYNSLMSELYILTCLMAMNEHLVEN